MGGGVYRATGVSVRSGVNVAALMGSLHFRFRPGIQDFADLGPQRLRLERLAEKCSAWNESDIAREHVFRVARH